MESFQEYLKEYQKQLRDGHIREAYQGLMEYLTALRLHLKSIKG